jgi:hypothetical protein
LIRDGDLPKSLVSSDGDSHFSAAAGSSKLSFAESSKNYKYLDARTIDHQAILVSATVSKAVVGQSASIERLRSDMAMKRDNYLCFLPCIRCCE